MKTSWCKFTVQGSGYFPFDMLRYDACYPATSDDAASLNLKEARTITLISAMVAQPTEGRWRSFGWQVIDKVTIK